MEIFGVTKRASGNTSLPSRIISENDSITFFGKRTAVNNLIFSLFHLTDYKTSLILEYPVIFIFTDKRAPEWFLLYVIIYYYTPVFYCVIIINVYRKLQQA